jgi:hypothetical protein
MLMRIFFLGCCLCLSLLSGAQVTFQKTYGGNDRDEASCIRQTFDGGFLIVGYTLSFGAGDFDIYVIKTTALGDTLWTRTLGGMLEDMGTFALQTADSGYIIAGHTYSLGGGCLIKLDRNGNLIWSKSYLGGEIYSAVESSNGDIAFAGITVHPGGTDTDIWFLKTDSAGNTLIANTYGSSENDFGISIHPTSSNGYVLYGESGNISPYSRVAIQIDSTGTILWSKKFFNSFLIYFVARNACSTSDNCSIIFSSAGGVAVDIIKVDSLGNKLWIKEYVPQNNFKYLIPVTVQETWDSGFIITGKCSDNNLNAVNTFLIKTNSTGNVEWSYIYGDTTISDNEGQYVIGTNDSGYAVAGFKYMNGGTNDIFFAKVDRYGQNACSTNLPVNETSPSIADSIFSAVKTSGNASTTATIPSLGSGGNVFTDCTITNAIAGVNCTHICTLSPNPFHSIATLNVNSQFIMRDAQLKIYNSLGVLVRTEKISNPDSYILHRNGLSDGLYFYKVQTPGSELIGSGKFVVE